MSADGGWRVVRDDGGQAGMLSLIFRGGDAEAVCMTQAQAEGIVTALELHLPGHRWRAIVAPEGGQAT